MTTATGAAVPARAIPSPEAERFGKPRSRSLGKILRALRKVSALDGLAPIRRARSYRIRLNHHIDSNAAAIASVAPIAAKIAVTSVGCCRSNDSLVLSTW
jgi:hypothetical protein